MHVSDAEAVTRAIDLHGKVSERLRAIPGVHGTGVGSKFVGGQRTDELAVLVYVHKKRPISELSREEIIPFEIEGIKTDVVETPVAECFDDIGRYRPLVGGSQLEYTTVERPNPNTTIVHNNAGTLGCMARARRTGKNVLLSNGHVLAGCGNPQDAINQGRRLGQPDDSSDCTCCSKCWATVVGTVVAAKVDPDAGILEIDKCVDPSPNIREIGAIQGVLDTNQINNLINQRVQMRGAKTASIKFGTVRSVTDSDNGVCRESDNAPSVLRPYTQAIRVDADTNDMFGQRGDSGSAVLDMSGRLVGLLFAGRITSPAHGIVARIDRILSEFQATYDLEIITAQNAAALGAAAATAPAAHPFAALEPAEAAAAGFQPTEEDLQLLGRARDEMLATPTGQHISQIIGRHVPEIQVLIRTRKRIAAVWRRVSAADVLRGVVKGLRSPQEPLAEFVEGAPLAERIAAMTRVLKRYGSQALIADLQSISGLAVEFSSKSYDELLEWAKGGAPQWLDGAVAD